MNHKKYAKLSRKLYGGTVQMADLKKSTIEHIAESDKLPTSGRLVRSVDGEVHVCFVITSRTNGNIMTQFQYDIFIDDTDSMIHPKTIEQWALWHSS